MLEVVVFLLVGIYMFIETSPPRECGDRAFLIRSVPAANVGKLSCLTFYYHMYGDGINTLNVYNGFTKVFTLSGNQGNKWKKMQITMTLEDFVSYVYSVFLLFKGYMINNYCDIRNNQSQGMFYHIITINRDLIM